MEEVEEGHNEDEPEEVDTGADRGGALGGLEVHWEVEERGERGDAVEESAQISAERCAIGEDELRHLF